MLNPNTNNRTDAVVKGDLFDGIIQSTLQAQAYPLQVWDYNEIVIELVKAFIDIWHLPEGAIPSKQERVKYKNWASQLDRMRTMFSSDARMRLAMKRAYDNYILSNEKIIIHEPMSIYPIVKNAIEELRKEEKIKTVIKTDPIASPEKIRKTVRDLKSILKNNDEE